MEDNDQQKPYERMTDTTVRLTKINPRKQSSYNEQYYQHSKNKDSADNDVYTCVGTLCVTGWYANTSAPVTELRTESTSECFFWFPSFETVLCKSENILWRYAHGLEKSAIHFHKRGIILSTVSSPGFQ